MDANRKLARSAVLLHRRTKALRPAFAGYFVFKMICSCKPKLSGLNPFGPEFVKTCAQSQLLFGPYEDSAVPIYRQASVVACVNPGASQFLDTRNPRGVAPGETP